MCRATLLRFLMILLSASVGWGAEELDKVRMQLKWQHQFQFAGYYAAIEKGFYEEEGLEVELLTPEPDTDPMRVVVEGGAEFGVSTSEIVQLVAEGEEVVALGVIYQHSPLVLVSLMETGLESLHDLAGKTIMMEPNSADLVAMFLAEGVDPDSITMVDHSFGVRELLEGKVAAQSAYITDEPFNLRVLGYEPIVMTPRSSGIDFYGDGLFTTREQVERHPERVEGFRRASLRGWEYAFANPEEIIRVIREKYSQRKSVEALRYEAHGTKRLARPDLIEVGYMNPGRWRYIAEVFLDLGLTDRLVEPTEFLYRLEEPIPWGKLLAAFAVVLFIAAVSTIVAVLLYRSRIRLIQSNQRLSEAKEDLRKSEAFYRNVYENAPLAFLLWGPDLRIKRWNRGAEKIFGWSGEEVEGRRFTDLIIPEDERQTVDQINRDIEKQGVRPAENWNVRKDGSRIWCQWFNQAKFDGRGAMIECHSFAIDATAYRKQNDALASEKEAAELLSRQKSNFLAAVSHEIRNPVGAILNFAALIREDAPNAEIRDLADVIVSSGDSLVRILNDLIDHEKLNTGRLEINPVPVDPGELVDRLVRMHRPMAEKQGLGLSADIAPDFPEVVLDPERFEQVLYNLLSNGIKFTGKGSVTVSLRYESDDQLPVVLCVKDTGFGIEEGDLKGIFSFYDRGKSNKRKAVSGAGVGLSICRNLVELMKGRIDVESTPGEGSVFTVRLPAGPGDAGSAAP